jgi:membrane-associated phospholipid phosphatase
MRVISRIQTSIEWAVHQKRAFALADWGRWVGAILIEMTAVWRRNRLKCVVLLLAVLAMCVLLLAPQESKWLKLIVKWRALKELSWLGDLSWALSEYGDFLGFNGLVWVTLYGVAVKQRSRFLRLVLVGSVLGTMMTGGCANILRPLVGRARPNARVEPGFYGPHLEARYHSFPSGHTATAFGGTVPILMAAPQVGIPLMAVSTAIAGSRLYNRAHHPSDVFFSIALALVFGVPAGLAVRRLRKREEESPGSPPN